MRDPVNAGSALQIFLSFFTGKAATGAAFAAGTWACSEEAGTAEEASITASNIIMKSFLFYALLLLLSALLIRSSQHSNFNVAWVVPSAGPAR